MIDSNLIVSQLQIIIPIGGIVIAILQYHLKKMQKENDRKAEDLRTLEKAKDDRSGRMEKDIHDIKYSLSRVPELIKEVGEMKHAQDAADKEIEHLQKRGDAVDMAISFIYEDSFSSNMIAKGQGGMPRTFLTGAKVRTRMRKEHDRLDEDDHK